MSKTYERLPEGKNYRQASLFSYPLSVQWTLPIQKVSVIEDMLPTLKIVPEGTPLLLSVVDPFTGLQLRDEEERLWHYIR